MTKKEAYTMMMDILNTSDAENAEELIAFVEHQLDLLAKRETSASARRKEKNAETRNALKTAIADLLSEEPVDVDTIMTYLTSDTKIGQVRYALREMVASGEATRVEGRKVMYTK